jgi:hypothetical protein
VNGMPRAVLRCLYFRAAVILEPILFVVSVHAHLDRRRWASLEFGEFNLENFQKKIQNNHGHGASLWLFGNVLALELFAFTGPVNYDAMFLQNVWLLIHR